MVYAVMACHVRINTGTKLTLDSSTGFGSTLPTTFIPIKDLETMDVSFDGNVEEWVALEENGWTNRLKTSNSMSVSMSGKRNVGDPGNDYIAGSVFADYEYGSEPGSVQVSIEFPDGSRLDFNAVANVTAMGGGDSTAVGALEFDLDSNGRPIFLEATP